MVQLVTEPHVHKKLIGLKGKFGARLGRVISMSETIEALIGFYEQNMEAE